LQKIERDLRAGFLQLKKYAMSKPAFSAGLRTLASWAGYVLLVGAMSIIVKGRAVLRVERRELKTKAPAVASAKEGAVFSIFAASAFCALDDKTRALGLPSFRHGRIN